MRITELRITEFERITLRCIVYEAITDSAFICKHSNDLIDRYSDDELDVLKDIYRLLATTEEGGQTHEQGIS